MAVLALVAALSGLAHAEQMFTLPSGAADILHASTLSGEPVGAKHRERFTECDARNTCDGKRLSCSKDRNRNTALLRLNSGAIFFDAKMGLDADGSPLSKARHGTDQPETSLRYPTQGSPSINADAVPFVVLPGGSFGDDLGLSAGDVVAVLHGAKRVFGVVADRGPACKLGEGSIQMHEMLGHRVCMQRDDGGNCVRLRNRSIEKDVLYFVFPGTHQALLDGLTPDNVNSRIEKIGAAAWDSLTRPEHL
jgi:hypothetical protein